MSAYDDFVTFFQKCNKALNTNEYSHEFRKHIIVVLSAITDIVFEIQVKNAIAFNLAQAQVAGFCQEAQVQTKSWQGLLATMGDNTFATLFSRVILSQDAISPATTDKVSQLTTWIQDAFLADQRVSAKLENKKARQDWVAAFFLAIIPTDMNSDLVVAVTATRKPASPVGVHGTLHGASVSAAPGGVSAPPTASTGLVSGQEKVRSCCSMM